MRILNAESAKNAEGKFKQTSAFPAVSAFDLRPSKRSHGRASVISAGSRFVTTAN